MKNIILFLLLFVSINALADSVDGSVSITNDYRFRGISQSYLEPSMSTQLEYTTNLGLWAGHKFDTVSKQEYNNGIGVESDYYAGFTHRFDNGIRIYVGDYEYTYPKSKIEHISYNTNELFSQIRISGFTIKYYRSLTDYFGTPVSVGTQYYSLDNYSPLGTATLVSHIGHTNVANYSNLSYTDWHTGPVINFKGIDFALTYYWNTHMTSTFKIINTLSGNEIYNNTLVLSISKGFQ